MDILSHYEARGQDNFVDCCWLANESDGYLAILLGNGDIELLSLSYSAIISIINLPESIKISSKLWCALIDVMSHISPLFLYALSMLSNIAPLYSLINPLLKSQKYFQIQVTVKGFSVSTSVPTLSTSFPSIPQSSRP